MTTVPHTSRVREHRPRAGKVPRPRQPVGQRAADADRAAGPRDVPGWPDGVPEVADVPTLAPVTVLGTVRPRTIAEPRLLRTGMAAAVGMLLVAGLLGAVGGVVLFWLGTSMLQYVR